MKRKPVPRWQLLSAARRIIKDKIKENGAKVNQFEAKQITEAAKALIATVEGKRMAARKARRL